MASSATWKINRIIFFYLLPIRKKTALDNLELCFPEKDIHWKKDIVKQSYVNLGINLTEFLYFPKLNKEKLDEFVRINDSDVISDAKGQSRGTFILSAHYSNWELMAYAFSEITDDKLNLIAKIQASRGLNKKINKFREMSGNEIIEIGLSLKNIFKKIHNNELFCFLADQSAHPDYSVYVNFFGMEVPAFAGPAKLAARLRPVLLLAYGKRNNDFSYNMNFEKINYDDINIESDDSIKILTQRIQNKFEEIIRKDPGQWLWFHKRFKHKRN